MRYVLSVVLPFFGVSAWAQRPTGTQDWVFPVVVDMPLAAGSSESMRTLYVVTNLGPETVGQMDFFATIGAGFQSDFRIPAKGTLSIQRFQDLAGSRQIGWTRLRLSSNAKISARAVLFSVTRAEIQAAVSNTGLSIEAVQPSTTFTASLVNRADFGEEFSLSPTSLQTAYAIVNPVREQTANVNLTAYDARGNIACNASLFIDGGKSMNRFASELFAPCTVPPLGQIVISSNNPIAVAALDVLSPGGQLFAVPVSSEAVP
ncbi:MAG: hypothetical protein HY644_12710 [Acidobacteria bacterium]|nr:hypothetical protein [Acidobacteriota bacterium]